MYASSSGGRANHSLRSGEDLPVAPPRSRRIVALRNREQGLRWYFKTREGVLVGAFRSEKEAEVGVQDFIDFMVSASAELRQRYLGHLRGD